MAILDIKVYGDKVLRKKAEPVSEVGKETVELVNNMITTMYFAKGVGLAAPQVGVSKRIIVVDATSGEEGGKNRLVLINPEIAEKEDMIESEEGCLSVPGINAKVKRARRIIVNGIDIKGKPCKIEAFQLLSIIIQHEIDHLNGILFVDHLTFLQKIFLREKLKEIKKKVNSNS